MIEDKKVSIITCFYNEEKYLSKSIDSVLAQTYTNFELILVNDGSTDQSDEIVKRYHDDRIIYLSYAGNKRQAYARNKGMEVATGDYIGFFDGDDILVPDKIEKQVKYLNENEDTILVSGSFAYMDENGNVDEKVIIPQYQSDREIKAHMLYRDCIAFAGGALLRRKILEQYGIWFDETRIVAEDYCFFISILPYGKCVNLEDCFFYYRVNHGSKSSMHIKNDQARRDADVCKALEYAWKTRGFSLGSGEIAFIYKVLNRGTKVWKPKEVLSGIFIYRKIKSQLEKLQLNEGKLILHYYKQQWLRTFHLYWFIKKVMGLTG